MKIKYLNQLLVIGMIGALTAFALTGCQPKIAEKPSETTQVTTPETTTPETPENPVEAKYKALIDAYVSELPTETVGSLGSEAEQTKLVSDMEALQTKGADSKRIHSLYMEGITKLSPKAADQFTASAIAGLRKNSFNDYADVEKFASDQKNLEAFFKEAAAYENKYVKLGWHMEDVQNEQIKNLLTDAKAKGYYLSSSEGMIYPLVDFTVFAKYRSYNSQGMANFIESLAIDDLEPMMSDAAFIVDMDNVAARAWHMEMLAKEVKGTIFESYLGVRFKDHMTMLFFGSNNTPSFDYETGKITETTVDLFKRVESLKNTEMSKLTTGYMTILEKNDGKLDDKSRPEAEALVGSVDATFNVTSDLSTSYSDWMSGQKVPKF